MKKVNVDYLKKLKKVLQKQKFRQLDQHREAVRLNPETVPKYFSTHAFTEVEVQVGKPPKNLSNLSPQPKLTLPNESPQVKQQINVIVKQVRVEDRTAEVVPKLLKINALADRIKRLKALQERIQECKQRIRGRIRDPENSVCKCKLNMMRECQAEGSHLKHAGREANNEDRAAFEPLIQQIKDKVRLIREENCEAAH